MANAKGKVTQVIGAVVDVQFDDHLPEILNALETDNNGNRLFWKWPSTLVKTPCAPSRWTATEGLVRGQEVTDTGGPITGARGQRHAGPYPERRGRARGRGRPGRSGPRPARSTSPRRNLPNSRPSPKCW